MRPLSPGSARGGLLGALAATSLALLVCGCQRGGELERRLDGYERELAEVTGVARQRAERPEEPIYPEPRERRSTVEEIRVRPLSALALRRCSLLSLVGERNSVLGRIQSFSGRFEYEARFLDRAADCLERLASEGEGEGELAAQLRELIEIKQKDLAAVFWNATFGANEMARHFGAGGAGAVLGPAGEADEHVIGAWRGLSELARAVPQASAGSASAAEWGALVERLEAGVLTRSLDELRSETRGSLLRALVLLSSRLDAASAQLEESHRRHACADAEERPTGEQLRGLERAAWSEGLRPVAEELVERTETWLDAVDDAFEEMAAVAEPAVVEYHARWLGFEEGGALATLESALLRHEEAWRVLLSGCGTLAPEPLR